MGIHDAGWPVDECVEGKQKERTVGNHIGRKRKEIRRMCNTELSVNEHIEENKRIGRKVKEGQ